MHNVVDMNTRRRIKASRVPETLDGTINIRAGNHWVCSSARDVPNPCRSTLFHLSVEGLYCAECGALQHEVIR